MGKPPERGGGDRSWPGPWEYRTAVGPARPQGAGDRCQGSGRMRLMLFITPVPASEAQQPPEDLWSPRGRLDCLSRAFHPASSPPRGDPPRSPTKPGTTLTREREHCQDDSRGQKGWGLGARRWGLGGARERGPGSRTSGQGRGLGIREWHTVRVRG